MVKWFHATCGLAIWFLLSASPICSAISVTFDYSFDEEMFFADVTRRELLEAAADVVVGTLSDSLEAIDRDDSIYSGPQFWIARFNDPSSGISAQAQNLLVLRDTIIVFTAGREFPPDRLAETSLGSATTFISNDPSFNLAAETRGQVGAGATPATDVGPWGGSIGFSVDADWGFSLPEEVAEAGKFDFFSTAVHELGHILGIGTADSWDALVENGAFVGPGAVAEGIANPGEPIAVDPLSQHWQEGTMSRVGGTLQEAAMDPTLASGTRKWFTDLDWAGLGDIGWQFDPDPLLGDMDCDGIVDFDDIDLFVLGLNDPQEYENQIGLPPEVKGDTDGDGDIDFDDVDGFVAILTASDSAAIQNVPEPGTAALLCLGVGVLARRRGYGRRERPCFFQESHGTSVPLPEGTRVCPF